MTGDPRRNPFARWFRGHSSGAISTIYDLSFSADYMGDTTDLRDVPKNTMLPLFIAEYVDGATPLEMAMEFVGVQSWEPSER